MFLLRFRRRHRFGPEADSLPRPAPAPFVDWQGQIPFDPEGQLDGCLDALEFAPELLPDDEPASPWDPAPHSDSGE
jgi:hypothetical protein